MRFIPTAGGQLKGAVQSSLAKSQISHTATNTQQKHLQPTPPCEDRVLLFFNLIHTMKTFSLGLFLVLLAHASGSAHAASTAAAGGGGLRGGAGGGGRSLLSARGTGERRLFEFWKGSTWVDIGEGIGYGFAWMACDSIKWKFWDEEAQEVSRQCKKNLSDACESDMDTCDAIIACTMSKAGVTDSCAEAALNGAMLIKDLLRDPFIALSPQGAYDLAGAIQCLAIRSTECIASGRASPTPAPTPYPVHGDDMGCGCGVFDPTTGKSHGPNWHGSDPASSGGRMLAQQELFVHHYCGLGLWYDQITQGKRWVKGQSGCLAGCQMGTVDGKDACVEIPPAPTPQPTPTPTAARPPLAALPATGGASYSSALELEAGHYTLTMEDSYGDGWNGALFTIEGVLLGGDGPSGPGPHPKAATSTVDFSLEERGAYKVTVGTGHYPGEVKWSFKPTPYSAWGCATPTASTSSWQSPGTCDNAGPMIQPGGAVPQAAAPATHTVNGACTFEAPSPFTVPDHYANNPQYNGLDASCKAWFFAGDTIFDVQADGPTAAFCGCCNACDPTGHGHGYGVCAQC